MPQIEYRVGSPVTLDEFRRLLDRFYELRGWDSDGQVPPERIAELVAPWGEGVTEGS